MRFCDEYDQEKKKKKNQENKEWKNYERPQTLGKFFQKMKSQGHVTRQPSWSASSAASLSSA